MKRNIIWLMTAVMAFAFIGLLYVQIMYMENMVKMRNEQFSEIVMRCLGEVSAMLERDETKHYLDQDLIEAQKAMLPSQGLKNEQFDLPNNSAIPPSTSFGQSNDNNVSSFSNMEKRNFNNFDSQFQSRQEILKGQYLYQKGLLNEVILNILVRSGDRPIAERVDSTDLRRYIKTELENSGLNLPFEFAVVNSNEGIAFSSHGYNGSQGSNLYSQPLFRNDAMGPRYTLRVTFPTKSDYIFSSVKFMLPSFAFTFILLFIFIYTIVVAFKQKKISEMKTEFINNMTHEFKTPISSISLAAQMLNDDAVLKSPTMMKQVYTVINDESKRLRFQVEKVLQLSMFERNSATMKLQEADANAIIDGVINTYKLKAEKFGGSVTGELNAEDPIVAVDEMHFTNVIFNLLDNAIKYRREDVEPRLKVVTRNSGDDKLIIEVHDNGIGIKREDLKRIFEKFYRVSTGNRHDVKGFGLGLAYVYKMIKIFSGDIKAESEYGKGSKFIITLPLIK